MIKNKSKTLLTLLSLLFSVILSMLCTSCLFFDLVDENDLVTTSQPQMRVEEIFGTYYVTITGSMKNTSNKTMDYVSVTFALYDDYGNVVGSALDNQLSLGAGQTWMYSATGMSNTNKPVKATITDKTVSCY